MNSSFDAFCDACNCHSERSQRRSRQSSVIRSFKYLGHRLTKSVDTSRSPRQKTCDICAQTSDRSKTWSGYIKPKKREEIPDPESYMTLTQLENMWLTQDVFMGSVLPPQSMVGCDMEASVAPTLGVQYPPRYLPDSSTCRGSESHDNVVGGIVHPALRPDWTRSPGLSRRHSEEFFSPLSEYSPYQQLQDSAWLCRTTVEVPTANWTYGRGTQ